MQREKKERPPKKKNRKKMHMLLPLPLLFSFFLGCPLFPFTPTAPLLVLTLFVLFSLLSLETVRNAKRQQFCPFVLVGFSLSLSRQQNTQKKHHRTSLFSTAASPLEGAIQPLTLSRREVLAVCLLPTGCSVIINKNKACTKNPCICTTLLEFFPLCA